MIGNIMHRTGTTPQSQVQPQGGGVNANTNTTGTATETTDTVAVGSHNTDASRLIGGPIVGIGIGVASALSSGVGGSFEAAERSISGNYKLEGILGVSSMLGSAAGFGIAGCGAMTALGSSGMLASAVGFGIACPAGFVLGAMVAPGAVGGIYEGVKGAYEGAKDGVKFADNIANKAETVIADKIDQTKHPKLANFVSKAGKLATFAATAAVAAPLLGFTGSISGSVNYAMRMMGVEQGKTYEGKEAAKAMSKGTVAAGGYMGGACAASIAGATGFIGEMGAGAAVSGGIASTVAGLSEAAKGFKEGYQEGKTWFENRGNQPEKAMA